MRKALSNWYVWAVIGLVLFEQALAWLHARPATLALLTATGFSLTVVTIVYAAGVTLP